MLDDADSTIEYKCYPGRNRALFEFGIIVYLLHDIDESLFALLHDSYRNVSGSFMQFQSDERGRSQIIFITIA